MSMADMIKNNTQELMSNFLSIKRAELSSEDDGKVQESLRMLMGILDDYNASVKDNKFVDMEKIIQRLEYSLKDTKGQLEKMKRKENMRQKPGVKRSSNIHDADIIMAYSDGNKVIDIANNNKVSIATVNRIIARAKKEEILSDTNRRKQKKTNISII